MAKTKTEIPNHPYSCEHWMIREDVLQRMATQYFAKADLELRARENIPSAEVQVTQKGRIAQLELVGPIVQSPTWWMRYEAATAASTFIPALRALASDQTVEEILIRVDSPGGGVKPSVEIADAVREIRHTKPITVQIDGLCCSGALYIASQASVVYANGMDIIGSIGVIMVLIDASELFEEFGIRVVPITTAEHKTTGILGVPITEEKEAALMRLIEGMHRQFVQAVADGRGMDIQAVEAIADGQIYTAKELMEQSIPLIDGIRSLETTLSLCNPTEATVMSNEPKNQTPDAPKSPVAATVQEIKTLCPGAASEFILAQVEAGHTKEQVQAAWSKHLAEENARLKAEKEELEAKQQGQQQQAAAGADPLIASGSGVDGAGVEGDPIAEWNQQIAAAKKAHPNMSHMQAVQQVRRRLPDLHAAYLEAVNENPQPVGWK